MGKQWKQRQTLFLGGLQNHCRWWLQPWNEKTLASSKKSYDTPRQPIKKQRHYFANKGTSCQSYGLSSSHVWMWELDHKAEHQRIDAFELWCWRRLLRVPWIARRSNQSILKEISLDYLLEGLMLKLKLHYFGHLIWRNDSPEINPWCWKRLKAGGEGDIRGWDGWMASPTQWTLSLSNLWELVMDWEACHAAVHAVTKSWTWLNNWIGLEPNPQYPRDIPWTRKLVISHNKDYNIFFTDDSKIPSLKKHKEYVSEDV